MRDRWCDGCCFATSLVSGTWRDCNLQWPDCLSNVAPLLWVRHLDILKAEAMVSWIVHYHGVAWDVLACFQVNFLRPFLEGAINGTPLTARWGGSGFNRFRWSHVLINQLKEHDLIWSMTFDDYDGEMMVKCCTYKFHLLGQMKSWLKIRWLDQGQGSAGSPGFYALARKNASMIRVLFCLPWSLA